MNMTTLHAQPYNVDAQGFYFTSAEEYTTKQEALRDRFGAPVEEFELQYIDGDDSQLFDACGINQCNLPTWFDDIEPLEDYEKAALFYLVDQGGYDLSDALERYDDVALFDGRLIDAATQLFDEIYLPEVPEAVQYYIDYAAFAYDCQMGGDMTEFNFNGVIYTCTNANGI
jgi:Antirestriction protein (ArdA)